MSSLSPYPLDATSGPSVAGLLLGDDVILDLVVGGLGQDLLLHQLVLPLVGAVLDDLLGVGVSDTRDALELSLAGRVQVQRLVAHRVLGGRLRRRRGRLGLS